MYTQLATNRQKNILLWITTKLHTYACTDADMHTCIQVHLMLPLCDAECVERIPVMATNIYNNPLLLWELQTALLSIACLISLLSINSLTVIIQFPALLRFPKIFCVHLLYWIAYSTDYFSPLNYPANVIYFAGLLISTVFEVSAVYFCSATWIGVQWLINW